ncbi:MAG TPA: PAS domain S-box protein, partial [Polyangiales bacterium]
MSERYEQDGTVSAADAALLWRAIARGLAIAEYDLEGTLVGANEPFQSMFGFARDGIVGENHRNLVPAKAAQSAEYRSFWSTLRAGQSHCGEYLRIGEGGRELYLDASYIPVLDDHGKVRKIIQYARDVTELRTQRLDYQGQLRAIDRALATIEFDLDGTILTANHNFLAIMGYEAKEVVGRHHRMFMPAVDAEATSYREFWARLRAGEPQTGEFLRRGKHEKPLFIQGAYSPILDDSGKPYKVVKYASDITAQRLTQLNFQAQLEAIGRSMAVIEFGLDGTVLDANASFLSVMGYQRNEVVGKHHRMFCTAQTLSSDSYEEFWQNLRAGKPQSGEFRR